MIKEMVNKKRFCHVVLDAVRTAVTILCKNQKWFTRMYHTKQMETHEHWLPHVLATVKQPVSTFQRKRWCQEEEEINKIKNDEKKHNSQS